MTFVEHGIHGAVLHAAPCALLGAPLEWQIVAAVTGFFAGIAPDILGDEFYLYAHYYWFRYWWGYIPALFLHVAIVDVPFHASGPKWFPRQGWRMILYDLICVVISYFVWFY